MKERPKWKNFAEHLFKKKASWAMLCAFMKYKCARGDNALEMEG